eukprot:COSAG01_NODE_1123_length_11617_cov_13.832769_8_plen_1297_part_00
MVIFVVGVSVFTSPTWDTTHPWYLLMWIEAYAYGASCLALEEGRPLMEHFSNAPAEGDATRRRAAVGGVPETSPTMALLKPLTALLVVAALAHFVWGVPVLLLARNTLMSADVGVPTPKYSNCSAQLMSSEMTIVVTVKDSCSQGPGFIKALESWAPPSVHLIYTYPKFSSCASIDMSAAKKYWDKLTLMPLPLRSSPMTGWIEAIPKIKTKYAMLLHNDGYAIDTFFGCELLQALKARNNTHAVAAPMLFESKSDGTLGAHATQSNLRLVKDEPSPGQVTVHHDHSLARALNRGNDLPESDQDDFLEDHGFLIDTDKIDKVIDPSASYTMEYLDMIFSLKSHNLKVLFVPTARLEFRITEFSWRDIPYFMYKRAESTCHGTRDYMSAKWKANFPNTGFWTFIKYTIIEQHTWEMPVDMPWKDQSAVVHGFMQMVGFNRYTLDAKTPKESDFVTVLEKIDDGYSSKVPISVRRSLDRPVLTPKDIKPTNIFNLTEILPYGAPTKKFPFGLEAQMPLEYMPFAVAEMVLEQSGNIPACEMQTAKQLSPVCGMMIQHASSCSCWINLPTFKSDSRLARWVYDFMAPTLKIPSRVSTYLEMWLGSDTPAGAHIAPLRRFESDNFRIFACDGGPRCTAEFNFPPASRLVQFVGMPAVVSEVEVAVATALGQPTDQRVASNSGEFAKNCVIAALAAYVALCYTVPALQIGIFFLCYCYDFLGLVNYVGNSADGVMFAVAVGLGYQTLQHMYVMVVTMTAIAPPSLVFSYMSHVLPRYSLMKDEFFKADGCDEATAARREKAFFALAKSWKKKFAKCIKVGNDMQSYLSDLRFSSGRVFMPFQKLVGENFEATTVVDEVEGTELIDLDGNRLQDISGSYGLNVIGYDRYKEMMQAGCDTVQELSCALGPLNMPMVENIKMIAKISQQEEVSFHMSGTEAVMCAVRLARFNSGGKNMVVTFNGAYHGWWDGMQPVAGNERIPGDVLCLKDISEASLRVLRARSDVAAVLVNPLQCFHPNSSPPSDLALPSNSRKVKDDITYYKEWLQKLRATCTAAGIFLIFDEVYTGFRLAPGGAQELFEVHADLVTYGKTLAGGNPVGVCCGPKSIMNRSDPDKPARVAYVIGTFAGHPGTMGSMNAFLSWVTKPAAKKQYAKMHSDIEDFVSSTNSAMEEAELPVRVSNFQSISSMIYTQPGRYHWVSCYFPWFRQCHLLHVLIATRLQMFQYYLKDEGVNLSWVGTGRCLFSMDWQPKDFKKLTANMLRAAQRMKDDGWWEVPSSDVLKTVGKEASLALLAGLPKKILG